MMIGHVAAALHCFLATYQELRVFLESAEQRRWPSVLNAQLAVLEALAKLERLLNPDRRTADAGRSCLVGGWPRNVRIAYQEVFWTVHRLVAAWGIPEICDGDALKFKRIFNRGEDLPRYVLTQEELDRLIWAHNILAGQPPLERHIEVVNLKFLFALDDLKAWSGTERAKLTHSGAI